MAKSRAKFGNIYWLELWPGQRLPAVPLGLQVSGSVRGTVILVVFKSGLTPENLAVSVTPDDVLIAPTRIMPWDFHTEIYRTEAGC